MFAPLTLFWPARRVAGKDSTLISLTPLARLTGQNKAK